MVGQALTGLVWSNAHLNGFVDDHQLFSVEADLLVLGSGVLSGVSWQVLWKKWAWLGIPISWGMSYAVLANVLSRHGWC